MTSPLDGSSQEGWSKGTCLLLGGAAALHVALLVYFTPIRLWFSGTPLHTFDYALHVYQVDRAVAAFRETGHLWSYDPFVLAGQPAGAVEDLTSKTIELFVIAATRLGVNRWVAFNSYVLLVHLGMPFAGWFSARLFRLSRAASALAVLFWIVLWNFDSLLHWCWFVGMISWSAASVLIVLVVALMYRAVHDRSPWTYALLGLTAATVTLVHPFAVLTLLLPLGVSYARAFSRLRAWEHAALVASVALAAATTLVWIRPALLFRHDIGPVDAFLWPTLKYVLFDWLELLKDMLMTGQPVRTVFRTVVFVLAAIEGFRWRARQDDRLAPLFTLIVGSFVLAYCSGYSSVLRQTQPYRNMAPAILAAALVAAALAAEVCSRAALRDLDRNARTSLALGGLLAAAPLARTVFGYLPTLLPARAALRSQFRAGPLPGVSNDELPLAVMGHTGPSADTRATGRYLESFMKNRGRVAAIDWVLGEYLSVFTDLPILGGIAQRNIPHVAAHPLRHDFTPRGPGDDPFRRYLEEYAVGSVVASGPHGPLDERPDLLERAATFGDFRVYRVREEPSYFQSGAGRIIDQRQNLIAVAGASGKEIVLRFHFIETLRCRPRCEVQRAFADRDAAGFIRIPDPPPAFEVYNAY